MEKIKEQEIKFENPNKLTKEEIKTLENLKKNPEIIQKLDKEKLLNLKNSLVNELNEYINRSKNEQSKKYINSLINNILNKIDKITQQKEKNDDNNPDNNQNNNEKSNNENTEQEIITSNNNENNNINKKNEKNEKDLKKEEFIQLINWIKIDWILQENEKKLIDKINEWYFDEVINELDWNEKEEYWKKLDNLIKNYIDNWANGENMQNLYKIRINIIKKFSNQEKVEYIDKAETLNKLYEDIKWIKELKEDNINKINEFLIILWNDNWINILENYYEIYYKKNWKNINDFIKDFEYAPYNPFKGWILEKINDLIIFNKNSDNDYFNVNKNNISDDKIKELENNFKKANENFKKFINKNKNNGKTW